MSTPLSTLLRESSRPEHMSAETRPFVTRLMAGELDVPAYTRYIANLLPVYRALENQTHFAEPLEGSRELWDERLDRVSSIERDLAALGAGENHDSLVTEASRRYAVHIDSLSGRGDFRLIAHHYTRYLGDLSGGQAIGALVARHYGLSHEQLRFCDFPNIDNIVRYKERYREILDSLELSSAETDSLVSEVKSAFAYNQAIFDEIGSAVNV